LMGDLASPVVQFVRDKCILAPGKWSSTDDLFEAWKNWCEEQGIKPVGSITFARNLKAAFPELSKSRPAAHGGRAYGYEGIALKSAATLTTEIPPKKAEVWENLENRPETKLTPLPHWAIPPRNGR